MSGDHNQYQKPDGKCDRCGEVNPAEIHTCTPKQEPVAVVSGYYGGQCVILPLDQARIFNSGTALYTTPPQREEGCAECGKQASDGWALYCVKCSEPVREWQGLTDEELAPIYAEYKSPRNIYLAIESALRSKNTCG